MTNPMSHKLLRGQLDIDSHLTRLFGAAWLQQYNKYVSVIRAVDRPVLRVLNRLGESTWELT